MNPKKSIPWSVIMVILGTILLIYLDKEFNHINQVIRIIIAAALPVIISITTVAYFFFRDPDRIPPKVDNAILSPADGKVIYIKEITNGEFPVAVKGKKKIPLSDFTSVDFIPNKGIQIGIAMSFLHVHVNRSPVEGEIVKIKRITGLFNSLKHLDSLLENERVFTQINSSRINLGIVQIASRLVRRIDSYKKENDKVALGERIGIIKFGSQVDLLIDKEKIEILTKVGDEVKAGLTVLAKY